MPANMKCGRLRASNCFEVFFPSPSFAKPPQPPSSPALFFSPRRFLSSLPADPRVYQQVRTGLSFSLSFTPSISSFLPFICRLDYFFSPYCLFRSLPLGLFRCFLFSLFFFGGLVAHFREHWLNVCNGATIRCINMPVKNNSYLLIFKQL